MDIKRFSHTWRTVVCAIVINVPILLGLNHAHAIAFQTGDVFAAVGSGNIDHYSSAGVYLETLNIGGSGFTTGMAFDATGNLYATGFSNNTIAKFDTNGALVSSDYASGLSTPESIVFDASGNFYVGNLNNGIRKYDAAGAFAGTVIDTRVDFFDLSADQSTFLYGQEGNAVLSVSNGLPGTPGANFSDSVINAFAMRILASGGMLVADRDDVKRLDAAGNVIQTYDDLGGTGDGWFALNLDPDGTSFWSGSFSDGLLHKIDIASGALLQTINTGSADFFGVAVFGEDTVGGPPTVPEPSTVFLFALGLLLMTRLNRRQGKKI